MEELKYELYYYIRAYWDNGNIKAGSVDELFEFLKSNTCQATIQKAIFAIADKAEEINSLKGNSEDPEIMKGLKKIILECCNEAREVFVEKMKNGIIDRIKECGEKNISEMKEVLISSLKDIDYLMKLTLE